MGRHIAPYSAYADITRPAPQGRRAQSPQAPIPAFPMFGGDSRLAAREDRYFAAQAAR